MPRTGLEPTHPCENLDLNQARLPIPPSGQLHSNSGNINKTEDRVNSVDRRICSVIFECMGKTRFIIVGSGWRSLYYVRIAKALPDHFELCALLCRTEEKAKRMAAENNIHATTSESECEALKPDVVVVAVNKASIAEVSIHWLEKGFCVLSETPAALELPMLQRLWELHLKGAKLVVNEQYHLYPIYRALLSISESGILGEKSCLNCSLAHEYHGASLMRSLLGIHQSEQFSIRAKTYEFPTTETLTRYESFTDGRIAMKKRTVATIEFRNGKVVLYDFDGEQYRSPIRKNALKLQGVRGEIIDNTVYYLDGENKPATSPLVVTSHKVKTDYDNPNLRVIDEVTDISFEGKSLYKSEFGQCALAQDETAMATMLERTAQYAKGGLSPYPLENALQDAYTMILMQRAVETGETVNSEVQSWN